MIVCEALKAAERGLKRLWEGYENLKKLPDSNNGTQAANTDAALNEKVTSLLAGFDEFMDDDFNTAKVMANMFELVPVINGIKDKHIAEDALSTATLAALKGKMKTFMEDIFGLMDEQESKDGKLDSVLQLLITIRKDARNKRDYITSDKIRNELATIGIQIKDEKDGNMSYTIG